MKDAFHEAVEFGVFLLPAIGVVFGLLIIATLTAA